MKRYPVQQRPARDAAVLSFPLLTGSAPFWKELGLCPYTGVWGRHPALWAYVSAAATGGISPRRQVTTGTQQGNGGTAVGTEPAQGGWARAPSAHPSVPTPLAHSWREASSPGLD